MNLDDDPELEEIEDEIEQCKNEHEEWKEKKDEAESLAKGGSVTPGFWTTKPDYSAT